MDFFLANRVYGVNYFQNLVKKEKTNVHLLQLRKQENETVDSVVTRTVKELSTIDVNAVLVYAGEVYRQKLLSEVRVEAIND